MKESIHDDTATIFASSFYRAIGFGRSIQEAFAQGRAALLLEGTPEEDIPELLVKDAELILIRSSSLDIQQILRRPIEFAEYHIGRSTVGAFLNIPYLRNLVFTRCEHLL